MLPVSTKIVTDRRKMTSADSLWENDNDEKKDNENDADEDEGDG